MPRAQIRVLTATVGTKEKVNRGAALIGRVKSKSHPGLAVPKDETDSRCAVQTFSHAL